MNHAELRFYPGFGNAGTPPAAFPLARFLPPLPAGMASAWLAENVPPGSWLLDPLGASPALALEAARAGYRVLVASNNPVLSFLIETLAGAPKSADFQSALAELATARRGDERLEHHIQHLYMTECDTCEEAIPVQAFLWRKGEEQPFARIYDCPKCGQSGEHPVTPADLDRLKSMGGDKLQRARALQRVILNEDEHRADVEEALDNYLPRSLYVLFTLANKLEGLGLSPERTRLLQALLLSTFDQGSTLWPWPGGRSRPKQLLVPPQFRENNVWLALEDAVKEWAHQPGAVRVTHWPALPPEGGGICLFQGRVKALMPLPETFGLRAVLTVFPRPNQAFWTLSVLWSGWLWGAEAALPLRNVLDRRRYDWNWHTSAIHSALAAVGGNIPAGTPFFGLLPELAPGFLSAIIIASEAAGFRLEGIALRGEQELAQGLWRPSAGQPGTGPGSREPSQARGQERGQEYPPLRGEESETITREAIRADLTARNEPASYLVEYAVGLAALARSGAVPRNLSSIPGDLLTRVQAVLARTFADRSLLKVFGGATEEERGLWWLAQKPAGEETPLDLPLADRVEMEVVRYLQKQPSFTFEDLDQRICAQFPGLLTPPVEMLQACLESYGESLPGYTGADPFLNPWHMRASESAAARRSDLHEARELLERIGQRLGFTCAERGSGLAWEKEAKTAWWFFPMASSIISRYVLAAPDKPAPGPGGMHRVIVLPGSRARLVSYKLQQDPRLAEAMGDGMSQGERALHSERALQGERPPSLWHFLKFRHLRDIAARVDLNLETWQKLLDEDPLTDDATQMQLFT